MSEGVPVVIGAGPAGLTAARELVSRGVAPTIFEATDSVGGISRTVVRDGWRFDIGGHRFFTKVTRVENAWTEILGSEDFLTRPRMSRIYYKQKFYDYPLNIGNALRNLGILESIRCAVSYTWIRIRPPKDLSNFEGWTASRFGWRLYNTFFKGYTEKVWGVPAHEIQADWAAQRIKNLSLFKAVLNSLLPKRNQKEVTSLIEEFQYPKLGPGMMWEACTGSLQQQGCDVHMRTTVAALHHENGLVTAVTTERDGSLMTHLTSVVISTMPFSELALKMQPEAPADVRRAAESLKYRDFMTVALVISKDLGFPDNWIYIHEPSVHVGRVQNFGQWSPHMVKPGYTCLGLEYFVFENDRLWSLSDEELIALAKSELVVLGLLPSTEMVEVGYVVRVPKAYPFYDKNYKQNVDVIRDWLADNARNVYPVGRNGMHKYNNQDHSMLTAMLSVENIFGANHDIWQVNVEQDYHEES